MPTTDSQVNTEKPQANESHRRPEAVYQTVFLDSPNVLVSLIRQIREGFRQPKITVPSQYYRGEAALPISEMRTWYQDLPAQIKQLPELSHYLLLRLARRLHLLPKSYEVPDIFQDYRQQPGSWLNSLIVHAIVIIALVLPFVIGWMRPKKQPQQFVNIVLDLPNLPPAANKAGGGGGGGDRTPTPPPKAHIPKFSPKQFTPPLVKVPNPKPALPMPATLLGPPQLKLPQMANNLGDPLSVPAPDSNGPGTGGGIGTGNGTGVGSGSGGGFGPGEGAGYGDGVYSVGGNVTAPVAIYDPDPPYSEEARKAKYSGTVVLSLIVDAQGTVKEVQVVKPLGLGLDENAVSTVKTWKFKPAERNGAPVAVRMLAEVTFRLF